MKFLCFRQLLAGLLFLTSTATTAIVCGSCDSLVQASQAYTRPFHREARVAFCARWTGSQRVPRVRFITPKTRQYDASMKKAWSLQRRRHASAG